MANDLLPILNSGPVGAAVVFLVLLVGWFMRQKGWLTAGGGKVVSSSELSKISSRVGAVEDRLIIVEKDIEALPTRKELHDLEQTQAVLAERMAGLERTTTSTNRAVARIEDFLMTEVRK